MTLNDLLFGTEAKPYWQKTIIGVVGGSLLMLLLKFLSPLNPVAIRTDLNGETEERKKLAKQVTEVSGDIGDVKSSVEQVRGLVELEAIVMTADPASEDRRKAIVDLKSAVRPRMEISRHREQRQ